MSKLNPGAFTFVPGQRFGNAPQQPAQPPPPPIERPEQTEAPKPAPTISLNIGGSSAPPAPQPQPAAPSQTEAKQEQKPPKPEAKPAAPKTQKADQPASSKTFTTERAKTDAATVAQDVKAAADQQVLEDLFGTRKHFIRSCTFDFPDKVVPSSQGALEYRLYRPC